MSDDFAICNNCGGFDVASTEPWEMTQDAYDELQDILNGNPGQNYKRILEICKQILILDQMEQKNLSYCTQCKQWVTHSWKHYEYGRNNDDE